MPAGRVVVGWDGSAGGDEAVRVAATEARRRGAVLDIVLVWDLLTQPGEFSPHFDQAAAERTVADAARRLVPPDTVGEVTTRAVLGQPAGSLLDASIGADLLVVGRRGHGTTFDRLLGSVSQLVLHHAICPVLVVPNDEETGGDHGA